MKSTQFLLAAAASGFGDDHLQPDLLKRELLVHHPEERHRRFVRHVRATQLDPRTLSRQLRMRFRHLAIDRLSPEAAAAIGAWSRQLVDEFGD